ncbi:MAG: apolipoprotein N-acyltransferase [Desulfobulbus propionicus]|nr:MAG: apolipoprotein N-acyltransferase [Desulfobulbus propionicus]
MSKLSTLRIAASSLATTVLLSLAMPGHVAWWPLLFVAFTPLLYLCLYLPPKQSALAGLGSGFLYHLVLLYWIVIVLGRYGGLPLFISVVALALLALYMSCYWGLFCFLLSVFGGRSWQRERSIATLVWIAPVLWVGLEYARGMLFSGFPWMDIGYGLYKVPQMIQAADLGGHHVISFVLVLSNAMVLAIIDRQRKDVRWNVHLERRLLLFAGAFLIFLFGYSFLRYDIVTQAVKRGMDAEIAVVQGNIDQAEKWSLEKKQRTVTNYVTLSESKLGNRTTELVVWPETALPFYLQHDPLAKNIHQFVTANNTWLLTGAPFYTIKKVHSDGRRDMAYFNAAVLIDNSGRVAGRYNKQHLVPFGEYVPFKAYLPFLAPLVVSAGNFTPGTTTAPLTLGRIKMGMLICYESIFPDITRNSVSEGANLLINLTNDAWYGRSSAPHQSMAMSVFRAVETKRSLVRAANTGISGFIDPVGNVVAQTELFEPAAVTRKVTLWEEQTVFTRSGYMFGACCLCLAGALLFFWRKEV